MLAFLRVAYIYIMITVIIPLVCCIPACIQMLVEGRVDAWRLCARVWMRCVLCVRIRTYGSPLIDHGIILANHISMMDGGIDNWTNQSEGIYRGQYLLSMLLYGLLTHVQGWGIRIHRGKTDRHSLINSIGLKLRATRRVLLYPEGTRCSYYSPSHLHKLSHGTLALKYGTLRSIYEQLPNTPVQVCISLQKDMAFNHWTCVDIPVYRGQSLCPNSFATCTAFTEAILDSFVECTRALHTEGEWRRRSVLLT
jgi:hypothetical protein